MSRVDDTAPADAAAVHGLVEAVLAAGADARTGRWLELVRSGANTFLAADGGKLDWYIFGSAGPAYRDLVEAVTSYVATSYATVESDAALPPAHPYTAAIAAIDSLVTRIAVHPQDVEATDHRLRLLADVWARRPDDERRAPRTTGRILRDVDDALAQGRLSEAEDLVEELRRSGRLTYSNLEFLEIRLLATAERWLEICARPDIEDLARMRLPHAVAAMLVEAAFHVHVEPRKNADPVAIVEHFRTRVEPVLGPAFRDAQQATTAAQRQAWIVYAAALEPPSTAIRDAVLALTESEASERRFVEAVAALVKEPESQPNDESYIEQLVRGGDLSGAWNAAESASLDEPTRVRALLHIAYEADNPSWAEAAVREARQLEAETPVALAGRTAQLQLAELSALLSADGRIIVDWLSWLRAVATHEAPERLSETARNHRENWSAESLLQDSGNASLILDVATSDPARALVLRQIRPLFLPAVLDAFDTVSDLQAAGTSIVATLAEVIASEERIGRHELAAVLELAERVLRTSAGAEEYAAVVERGLREAWLRGGSARQLGWLADAVLLVGRAGDRYTRPRNSFLEIAAASAASFPLLTAEDREALTEAFSFAGIDHGFLASPELEAESADSEVWTVLAGNKTVIYTLVEAAGARAREFIRSRVPDADVIVLTEHDADRRLIEHARRADVIAIATRAAKHAATIEFERQRRPDAVVVYPTGKGWSSIVGALREACRALK